MALKPVLSNSAPVATKALAPVAIQKASWVLPLEKTIPKDSLSDFSILLYGEPKVGKTDLAAQFPDAFFKGFEPGARAQSVYTREIESWLHAKHLTGLLQTDKRFRTVVWDTADIAYQMCLKQVCIDEGFSHPSDEGYGKGWNKVNSAFSEALTNELKTGKGFIAISHAVEKEITTRLGEKYEKIVPTLSGGARNIVEALVDIWIYMYHGKDGERYMRIRGNEHIAAGHRLQKHFAGVDVVPMGKNAQEAYINLCAAFHNKLKISVQEAKPTGQDTKTFALKRR